VILIDAPLSNLCPGLVAMIGLLPVASYLRRRAHVGRSAGAFHFSKADITPATFLAEESFLPSRRSSLW